MKLHDAIEILNEARMTVRPEMEPYTVERILTSASSEVRLTAMYIAEQLTRRAPARQKVADVATLNRAVTALKHFAVDGGEPCDYLSASLLAQTPAGVAICWFDTEADNLSIVDRPNSAL